MFSSHDCIFHVEQVPTDWQFLFSACGVNMPPPWLLPLRHSHSCLYTRSVFERKKMNCDTVVIHACTRGLSFEFFFLIFASVRPGHAHDTERRTAAAGRRITLCTYLQPRRGTARGLQSFGACTATRNFLTEWGYQKILLENVLLEKAFSDNIRRGVLVPYQKVASNNISYVPRT